MARRSRSSGSRGWRIEWDTESLERGFGLMDIRIKRFLHAHVVTWSVIIESHMKISAPWTDDTGMARFMLAAEGVRKNQNQYWVLMTHGVPYGKWLEVANQRRYAIILPTMYTHGQQCLAATSDMLDRIDV